jgi:hypothetical protein
VEPPPGFDLGREVGSGPEARGLPGWGDLPMGGGPITAHAWPAGPMSGPPPSGPPTRSKVAANTGLAVGPDGVGTCQSDPGVEDEYLGIKV